MTYTDMALIGCGIFMIGLLFYLYWQILEEEFGFRRK